MIIGGGATGGAFLSWAACGSSSWAVTGGLLHAPRERRAPSEAAVRSGRKDFCMSLTSETASRASRPFYTGNASECHRVRQGPPPGLIISLGKQRGGDKRSCSEYASA